MYARLNQSSTGKHAEHISELQAPSTVDMISRLLVVATLALVTTAEGAAKHPHIVHIVADDLGYK